MGTTSKKYKWSEARHLFEMVQEILSTHGDMVDDVHICEHDGEYSNEINYKVYCSAGYCLEINRELSDEDNFTDAEDGFVYTFCEPWDGFKEAGYAGAVEVLSRYCDVKRRR